MNMSLSPTRTVTKNLTRLLLVLLILTATLWGQTSNVTATITDPDSQTWNNGSYTISFVPTPGIPGPYSWQGNPNFPQNYTGTFSSSGVLTISLPDNNFIAPLGSKWQFTLCSDTSAPCQNVKTIVTGSAPNLSTILSSPLSAPRFGPGQFSFGYLDVEVSGTLLLGSFYYNVTDACQRIWSGTAWSCLSTGGSVTDVLTSTPITGGPITITGTVGLSTACGNQPWVFVSSAWACGSFLTTASQYTELRCESGLGDGFNLITADTYLQTFCYNDSGVTWTITGIKCYVDGGSASTLNASGHTLGALLTGAVTCGTASFAAGTQSANVLLTAGDYIQFTFVADGTAKQTTWVMSFTQ